MTTPLGFQIWAFILEISIVQPRETMVMKRTTTVARLMALSTILDTSEEAAEVFMKVKVLWLKVTSIIRLFWLVLYTVKQRERKDSRRDEISDNMSRMFLMRSFYMIQGIIDIYATLQMLIVHPLFKMF